MDLSAYRRYQDSGWIREQRDLLEAGERAPCPVVTCPGNLEAYDLEGHEGTPSGGMRPPGGVKCTVCRATSRPVTL